MAKAKFTITDVANYFLACAGDEDSRITPRKLYKLVYFAQALALVTLRKPLFDGKIEAQENGPVPVDLWKEYGGGEEPIPPPKDYDEEKYFNEDEINLLYEVNRAYARYDAWYLKEKTHEEGLYQKYHAKGENTEYELDEMKEYFSSTKDEDVKKVINNFHYIRELLQSIKESRSGKVKPYKATETN